MPIVPVIVFYAIRMRKFFFFSNVNPKFKTGALLGASKYDILQQLNQEHIPKTIILRDGNDRLTIDQVVELMQKNELVFPCIAKPDVGERGLLVELIHTKQELQSYLEANSIDIIIQEYIELPQECGIFYIRKPNQQKGKVVSVGLKRFMTLSGDGVRTVEELLMSDDRYRLQLERIRSNTSELLSTVIKNGETLNIEPIGNHSRGTHFLDGNHLLSEELDNLFDQINQSMDEVYYGRFDLKYQSWEELLEGKQFKILELNGVASEPIHVYDSRIRIRDKYRSFYQLWKDIFEISTIQRSRGVQPISVFTAIKEFLSYKKYMNSLNLDWRNAFPK